MYAALKARLSAAGFATGLGDEGGFAPNIALPEDVLTTLVEALNDAGYTPGRDGIAIALDPAASEFCRDGAYHVCGELKSGAPARGERVAKYNRILEIADAAPDVALHSF